MNIILLLNEEDLIKEHSVNIKDITISDFKSSTFQECRKADLVIYTNDLGESNLLKNRFPSFKESPVDLVIDAAKLFLESE